MALQTIKFSYSSYLKVFNYRLLSTFSTRGKESNGNFSESFQSYEKVNPDLTIETDEANKFRRFASHWWNPQGELGPLHTMNRLRVPFIRNGLCSSNIDDYNNPNNDISIQSYAPLRNKKILDVGCGGGILSEALATLGAEVLGIDQLEESIEVAQTHAELTASLRSDSSFIKPEFKLADLNTIANQNPGYYDAVVASEVLEHVTDWESMLQVTNSCLRPGGMLFITTLNKTISSLIFGIVAAEYILHVIPTGTHEWKKFISPDNLQSVCIRLGFEPCQIVGMKYNPLTGRWSWTSNLSVNYAFSAIKND